MLVGINLTDSSPIIGRTSKTSQLSNPFIPHKLAGGNS